MCEMLPSEQASAGRCSNSRACERRWRRKKLGKPLQPAFRSNERNRFLTAVTPFSTTSAISLFYQWLVSPYDIATVAGSYHLPGERLGFRWRLVPARLLQDSGVFRACPNCSRRAASASTG